VENISWKKITNNTENYLGKHYAQRAKSTLYSLHPARTIKLILPQLNFGEVNRIKKTKCVFGSLTP
jgi:hypothetical protein